MATQARETPSKSQPIKPLLRKYVKVPNASTLVTIKKRNEKFRSFTLQVHLWKSMKEASKTLSDVRKMLKNSKTLRNFYLFDHSQPSDRSLQFFEPVILRLSEGFKNHLALVKVAFLFAGIKEAVGKALNLLARRLSQVALQMRAFSFGTVDYNDDEDKRKSRLSKKGLRRLRYLQDIALRYPCVKRQGVNPLADWEKSLVSYKDLKSLSLTMFGVFQHQDEQLTNVGECLQKFHSLKKFRIELGYDFNQVTKDTFSKLFEQISKMASLESLCLGLSSRCLTFTDDCLKSLGENLAKMSALKRLDLNLDACQKVSNEGVEFLSKNLQEMPHLTFLKLDLSRCQKINTRGLRALEDALKNIKLLKEVHLIFECCQWINAEDIEVFALKFKETPFSLKITYQYERTGTRIAVMNSTVLEKKEDIGLFEIFEG